MIELFLVTAIVFNKRLVRDKNIENKLRYNQKLYVRNSGNWQQLYIGFRLIFTGFWTIWACDEVLSFFLDRFFFEENAAAFLGLTTEIFFKT